MIQYEVRAFDIQEKREITFNHNITKTLDEAFNFASHLKELLSNYYCNIAVVVTEYKQVNIQVFKFDNKENN